MRKKISDDKLRIISPENETSDQKTNTNETDIDNETNGDSPSEKKINKKLPSIYRGSYTQKNLDRKLLKRIYIPADRDFVSSFFTITGKTKKGTDLYSIPKDTNLTKKEFLKLCLIAKELKSQKSRVKWIPLVAVASFIFIICVLFATFKNKIIKSVIQDTCESIFQAKCDIDKVDFRLFDASFKLYGLQIANKNSPMKNLFEVDSIVFDFDLTQLLRLRFVTDEISINGVRTNTNRKYSGDISAKLAKQREKKRKQEEKKAAASPFMKNINNHIDASVATIQNSIEGFINYYNPTSVIENSINSMRTDDVAKEIQDKVTLLCEKWSSKPEEVSVKIKKTEDMSQKLIKYEYSSISKNPEKIKEAIELIDEAYKQAKDLREETELIINDIKKDFNNVEALASELSDSIKHDKSLVDSVINRYKNLGPNTVKNFIGETLNKASYSLLGKYYPVVNNVVSYLVEMKNMNKEKGKKTEKEVINSMIGDRSKGRTVYYKNNPPKFWIKKIAVSGNLGNSFNFEARNISSNMDQSGLPASASFSIKLDEITHSAKVVVDCRSYSDDPLVLLDYNCDNLPVSTETINNSDEIVPGVPVFNAKSNLDGMLKIYENDGFSLTGTGIFTDMIISSYPFEPEYLYNVYSNVLSEIKDTKISATVGYTVSNGILLDLNTDLGEKIYNSMIKELTVQLELIKKEAETLIIEKINQYSNGALGEINSFEDIFNKLSEYADYAKNLETELKVKQKSYENMLTSTLSATKDVVEKTVTDKVESMKESIVDSSTDYLKGLLKF